LLSSYFQQALPIKSLAIGEISLTGQIKPVNQINSFVKEASIFGINNLFVAKNQKIEKSSCKIKSFSSVYELLGLFTSQ
jgi:predicted ATP-dependent serine protease